MYVKRFQIQNFKKIQNRNVNGFRALITSVDKLPEERKEELEQTVRGFYGVEDLDDELLEETAEMDTK